MTKAGNNRIGSCAEIAKYPVRPFDYFEGQDRIPEAIAPKFLSGGSTLAVIDAQIDKDAEGVLFALGGTSSGFAVYMDKGLLKAE